MSPVLGGVTNVGAIVLPAAPTTTVSGVVLGPDGMPLAGAGVQIASLDLADLSSAVSGADGKFVAAGFPVRQWSLTAYASATVGGGLVSGRAGGTRLPRRSHPRRNGRRFLLAVSPPLSSRLGKQEGLVVGRPDVDLHPRVQLLERLR